MPEHHDGTSPPAQQRRPLRPFSSSPLAPDKAPGAARDRPATPPDSPRARSSKTYGARRPSPLPLPSRTHPSPPPRPFGKSTLLPGAPHGVDGVGTGAFPSWAARSTSGAAGGEGGEDAPRVAVPPGPDEFRRPRRLSARVTAAAAAVQETRARMERCPLAPTRRRTLRRRRRRVTAPTPGSRRRRSGGRVQPEHRRRRRRAPGVRPRARAGRRRRTAREKASGTSP